MIMSGEIRRLAIKVLLPAVKKNVKNNVNFVAINLYIYICVCVCVCDII